MTKIVAPAPLLPDVAPYIQSCIPYPPGKPMEELQRELGLQDVIKLASNENPDGASPLAVAAIQKALGDLRLYPDAAHYYLREAIAAHLGVNMDEILVGNGSNEIFDFLIRTYCRNGDNVVSCGAAFVAYRVCAQVHGVEYREPALERTSLTAELQAMEKLVDEKTRIVFLPNPNNPTGTYVNRTILRDYLKRLQKHKKCLIVLDYAYWEYVTADDLPDAMEFYREFPNVLVTRTFSKIYGLAGLRVGYGVAHPEILAPMRKVKMPFNVSNLALVAARAALLDVKHVQRSFQTNCEGMNQLETQFKKWGIEYWPSQANFLLVRLEQDPKAIYEQLLREGVIVRPVAGYGLREHLRISIGSKTENERLLKSLKKVMKAAV